MEGYTCLEFVHLAMYGDIDWAGCKVNFGCVSTMAYWNWN